MVYRRLAAFFMMVIPVPAVAMAWLGGEGIDLDTGRESLARGAAVFIESCQGCHGLRYIKQRHLMALGLTEPELSKLLGDVKPEASLDSGTSSDSARAIFGMVPPDLSLIVKAREGGARYVHDLLTGYYVTEQGKVDNRTFPGTSMPDILGMSSAGSPAARQAIGQQARQVTAFLQWAADPKAGKRHTLGYYVLGYLAVLTVLLYLIKRRVWKRLD